MTMRMRAATVLAAVAVALAAGATPAVAWLNYGPITQYPSAGGVWEYGFWNAGVRSYYTVNRCHGSTVELNGSRVRSADTAAGRKSIADKFAYQNRYHDDRYYYRTC